MATKASIFELMVGHVVAQARWYRLGDPRTGRKPLPIPWSRVIAIAIHSHRPKFGEAATYLGLAERLRITAQARVRAEVNRERRKRRATPRVDRRALAELETALRASRAMTGIVRTAVPNTPAWMTTARRAILQSEAPASATKNIPGRRAKPKPPTRIPIRPTEGTGSVVLLTPGQHQAIGASIERMAHAGASRRARAIPGQQLDDLAHALNARRL